MPNLLMPDTSSYSNPNGNALLAAGGSSSNAMDASTSNALAIANQAQQLQSGKVTIDQQTYNLAKSKMDSLHQVYQSIVDNPDPDNVTWQIGQGVKAGIIDPQQGTDAATRFASFGGDRQKIQQFALNGMNVNQSHQEALEQAYGAPQLVNTGGQIQPMRVVQGPNAGVYSAGGTPLAVTTSPGDKIAAGRTVTTGVGGQTFVPGSALYDDRGNYTGGQAAGGGSGDQFVNAANGVRPERKAPPPIVGGNKPPPMVQGAPPPALPGQGQGVPPAQPAAPQGQGAAPGSAGAMVTPNPQTLPAITQDQATAAMAAWKNGNASAVDRNVLRGFAVQNNIGLDKLGAFEPQPAGVGAAVSVPGRQAGGGAPGASPAGAGGVGAGAAPAPGGTIPPGRQPPGSVQAGGGQPSAVGGAGSGVGPGGLVTSLSPGQQASLAAGSNGYSALSADVSAPTGVNQRLFQLRTALGALRNTQTGLGTAQRQQLVGYMASLPGGLDKWAPGLDVNSATNYDIATKYLNAYSLNTPGAARSDAGLSTAQSANANTSTMMQRAAMDVTSSNIGLEVGKQALLNAFEKSGADPGTFNKFASKWGQAVDPRAFALGDMTAGERANLFNGLQGQQRANFIATVRKGMAAGVIHKSDLTGATGNGQ